MVLYLRARGTGQIVGQCQADNLAMLQLARQRGFVVGDPDSSSGLTALQLDLQVA
jgi:hypothetical protein